MTETAAMDDGEYGRYVREKIAKGLSDVESGRVVSHEEAQRRLARWLHPDVLDGVASEGAG
jgi:predicted transcriptional regulator